MSGGDICRITYGIIGKILSSCTAPLLTEELAISAIEDYKEKRNQKPHEPLREAVGDEKKDILNIVHNNKK